MKIELKPCPFCGGEVRATSFDHGDGKLAWNVTCWNCYADMGHYGSLEELAERWNRRA